MPFFFSERLPVPTLKSYFILSSLIFITSLIYGKDCTYRQILSGTSTSYYEAFLAEPFCLWVSVRLKFLLPYYSDIISIKRKPLHNYITTHTAKLTIQIIPKLCPESIS